MTRIALATSGLAAGLCFVLVAGEALSGTDVPKTKRIEVAGPTIVGFLPPNAEHSREHDAEEAVAHVQFALADTRKCLGKKRVKMELHFADRFVVRLGGKDTTIEVANRAQGVGALLLEPGRESGVVFAEIGPSSLALLLPEAAGQYWDVKQCKDG